MEEEIQEQILLLLNNIFISTPIEHLENEVFAYGIRNYMAKYSLQDRFYGVSNEALTLLRNENLINQQPILRSSKSVFNFKYEHVVPMKVLYTYVKALISTNQYNENLFREMMINANKVFIITSAEKNRLDRRYNDAPSLQKSMPFEYDVFDTFWNNGPEYLFSRYIDRHIEVSNDLIEMQGAVIR